MFPRPNFCCLCGEKIERVEWHVWTSRRFCEVCESENVPAEWLPRAAAAVLTLFGLFGVGSALRGPERKYDLVHSPVEFARQHASEATEKRPRSDAVQPEAAPPGSQTGPIGTSSAETGAVRAAREGGEPSATPARYFFCGAATKKGTPCNRKVKGGGRCWQHKGMKALVPESELEIRPENAN